MKVFRHHLLLVVPICVYIASYIFLALYHKNFFIWNTVVHESGRLTFYQTLFYSSHFLGHLVVHISLSLLFVGYYITFSKIEINRPEALKYLILTVLFLVMIFAHSMIVFGPENTFEYIFQERQGEFALNGSGSWNLHLVSTTSFIFILPLYLFILRNLFNQPVYFNSSGISLIAAGVILILVSTYFVNFDVASIMVSVWKDDRYLAHSVREIATFTVTYFPLCCYLFIQYESNILSKPPPRFLISTLLLFALSIMAYQVYYPLTTGIENLSQQPQFTRGRPLSIPYLLASHYFEHFIDSIFFVLFSLLVLHVFENKHI